MATYAIGDVQGCFIELKKLLDIIRFNPQKDTLWFVGDLVNRGPNSIDVLRFIRAIPKKVIVLGNHDLHLLAVANGTAALKTDDTIQNILQAPDCNELCHWLKQQSLFHYDETLKFAMVHAGLPPQWSLADALRYSSEIETVLRGEQAHDFLANLYGDTPHTWNDQLTGIPRLRIITNYFTRIRFCDTNGMLELKTKAGLEKTPPGFLPWFEWPHRATQDLNIVFGHWAALKGKTGHPHAQTIDTGCVWGKFLTALCLEDGKRYRASAHIPIYTARN